MGILSTILLTPAIGALVLALLPGRNPGLARGIGKLFTSIVFLLTCYLLFSYDSHDAGMQFNEYFSINPKIGSSYALGVDGLSVPLVVLASLLTLLALLASAGITKNVKGYNIGILLSEFGMLGVFLAQDWSLFYIFWEITLIPIFFLIDRWGGKRRQTASLNFVLYTMTGSVFMLVSLIAVFQYVPEQVSLMSAMTHVSENMPKNQQAWAFIGFLIGFGVKMPIFPLHGWLPLAHVEAPSPVSILLSGILIKMGAYGLLRVVVMLPTAAHTLQPLLVFLALFGIIYGGLLAWRQSDLKAMVAYSSISHMGIVLLGISTLNEAGLTGAVLQMSAHGLIAGGMFMVVGMLYERTHTRNIQDYSSLAQVMPRFAFFTTIILLAAMGIPGSIGAVAELHAMVGGFQQWGGLMVFFSMGILISTAYAIRTIGLLFTGPVKPQMKQIEDLRPPELLALSVLVGAIVLFGLLPASLVELSAATISQMNGLIRLRILEG